MIARSTENRRERKRVRKEENDDLVSHIRFSFPLSCRRFFRHIHLFTFFSFFAPLWMCGALLPSMWTNLSFSFGQHSKQTERKLTKARDKRDITQNNIWVSVRTCTWPSPTSFLSLCMKVSPKWRKKTHNALHYTTHNTKSTVKFGHGTYNKAK